MSTNGTNAPNAPNGGKDLAEQRARAIALLEATHAFPVAYELSVIALSNDGVFALVRAAIEVGYAGPWPPEGYQAVPSSAGRYTSHRFKIPCARPEDVLDLYARLRAVEGVMTVL